MFIQKQSFHPRCPFQTNFSFRPRPKTPTPPEMQWATKAALSIAGVSGFAYSTHRWNEYYRQVKNVKKLF